MALASCAGSEAATDGPDGSVDTSTDTLTESPDTAIADSVSDVPETIADAVVPTTSECDFDPASKTVTPAWGDPEPACTKTYDVAAQADLDTRLAKAVAGDCIVVADGTYTIGTVEAAGAADHPIVLSALHAGKAVFSAGTFTTSAKTAHFVVRGFDWTSSGPLHISGCDHCRITRNRIRLTESTDMDWIVMTNSDYARIDHNEIGPKAHTGNPLSIFGTGGAVATHTRIDHNYVHDLQTGGDYPSKGCGFNPGGEAIRVGVSSLMSLSAFTIVEYNLFENCDGDPELVSTKTSDNVVRYNTVRSSAGSISLRAGDRVRVCGNFVLGEKKACSGGIRLCGAGHTIFDNYVQAVDGYTMELHAGDATHAAVSGAKVVFNTLLGQSNGLSIAPDSTDSVIADNIFTGTSGNLVKAGATLPTGLVIASNLAPTGAAKLGVTWKGFADLDPMFVPRGELSVLGSGSTNAIGKADKSYPFVSADLDGQPRDDDPDIGADEYASSAILRAPLTAASVGPKSP
ncbi:MAG: polysaccharide lyase 6 family protein [Polyangiales bacterium]